MFIAIWTVPYSSNQLSFPLRWLLYVDGFFSWNILLRDRTVFSGMGARGGHRVIRPFRDLDNMLFARLIGDTSFG